MGQVLTGSGDGAVNYQNWYWRFFDLLLLMNFIWFFIFFIRDEKDTMICAPQQAFSWNQLCVRVHARVFYFVVLDSFLCFVPVFRS